MGKRSAAHPWNSQCETPPVERPAWSSQTYSVVLAARRSLDVLATVFWRLLEAFDKPFSVLTDLVWIFARNLPSGKKKKKKKNKKEEGRDGTG